MLEDGHFCPWSAPVFFFNSPVALCNLIGALSRCVGFLGIHLRVIGDELVEIELLWGIGGIRLVHGAGFEKGNCRQLPRASCF